MHPKALVFLFVGLIVVLTAAADAGLIVERGLPAPQARITQLPDDSMLGWVTIVVHDDWQNRPDEKALLAEWFATPEVSDALKCSHYLAYAESDTMYQTRIKQANPTLPAIIVQDSLGRVTYKDHGEANVSGGVRRLVSWRNGGNCDRCRPNPAPSPDNTNVVVPVMPIPDRVGTAPLPAPAGSFGLVWGIIAAVAVLTAIGTCAVQFHKRVAGTMRGK